MVEIIRIPRSMQDISKNYLIRTKKIGFVPTMGALHEGHLSLVRRSREENDITVASIFVNPTQFGPNEDFQQYPRDIDGDSKKLQRGGADILFLPDTGNMYQEGHLTHVEVKNISDKMCGAFRPGHFRGVATIVAKLFNVVMPTRAYFGQKDYQQTLVIKKMVSDLNMDIDVVVCPTIREKDGLAMSSRNAYLDKGQREASTVIYRCLQETSDLIKSAIIGIQDVKASMLERLLREPAVSAIEYAGVYDPATLDEPVELKEDILLAVALRIENTRLIDNMLVTLRKER